MLVFVVDRYGAAGHPTRRMDWVRKQLQRKRARMVGGGVSGKPAVLVLLDQAFDLAKTVHRRFVQALVPGSRKIGFAVAEVLRAGALRVLLQGELQARTADIRKLMDDLRMNRRSRRSHRRENVKRKGWVAKCRPPRYDSRGKRDSVTLRHALETHRNLFAKLLRLVPVPASQVIRGFRKVSLDLRALIYGKPETGYGYQISPVGKERGEKVKCFVIRRDGGCLCCGRQDGLQNHHLRKRSRHGTNRPQNLVCLCADCHEDVHAGLMDLPMTGGVQWRDASLVNAVCGKLRKGEVQEGVLAVAEDAVVAARRRLDLERTKAGEAVATAAAMVQASLITWGDAIVLGMEQFRRHRRQRIHAQRDRLYVLDGKVVAHNRRKRCDQGDVDSLAEFRAKHPSDVGRLRVKRAVRLYKPSRKDSPAVGGDVWIYRGQPFVVNGTKDNGHNLHAMELEPIIGKTYLPVAKARCYLRNTGIVVMAMRNLKIALQAKGNAGMGQAVPAALSLSGLQAGVSRAFRWNGCFCQFIF